MTVLHKITAVPAKKFASDQELFPMICSTENPDRYGDVLVQRGWNLKEYMLNNVVLLGHNASIVVARMINLRIENNMLKGDLQLAPAGVSARVDECRALVKNGFLRACSVGFVPTAWKDLPNGSKKYTKMTLLEISLVALPANVECLMEAKALGISNETIKMIFKDGQAMTLTERVERAKAATRRARALLAKPVPSTGSKSKVPLLTMSQQTKDKYTRARAATKKARELLAKAAVDAKQQPTDQLNRAPPVEGTWQGCDASLMWRGHRVEVPRKKNQWGW
jgi:HK97 family phage prohead protease